MQQVAGERGRTIIIADSKDRLARHLVRAIRAENGCMHPQIATYGKAEHRNRAVAGSTQRSKQRPLRHYRRAAGLVIDRGQQIPHPLIIAATFQPDCPLCGCRQPLLRIKHGTKTVPPKPREAGGGQQRGVCFLRVQPGKACCHVPTKGNNAAIGPRVQQLRGAARRTGAHPGTMWQRSNGFRPDQDVRNLRARQYRCGGQPAGPVCLHILHGMHRSVDAPFVKPFIQFLGPQGLATDFGKGAILYPVPAGNYRDQLDQVFRPAMRGAQARARLMRLCHGEGRSARTKTQAGNDSHMRCLP